ncbi:TPA: beta-ketoacyl-[acyl-carrier-protein] synthase family protein [Serratia marcescens]|jgi:3-oxoacyl-(acyl-carrier-protein) synthase|uniref:Beta-ketoacyl-[acyl-carrier-protein] synthase family protein n=2 Tax=Serratia marcescens TaxID=615 RepID=A0ABD5BRE3_SERMA|nr:MULTISPECIES: beta-ketoacyl-[acyl-carrier-protein] synthase family protein [Serratia]AUU11101.1 beta-ketoacyl-[acyl-carrier-protein] synthase family protein [Serratia marcescens]AVN49965.1 beta-ketoacyl-[acyl-carrier-protein] synthase family protein [Serratia marcescens]AWC73903.1 beta-ketoacyl-[acyl-carrier-protein] synthase family protein [Serratia marcescens]EGS5470603.1 beta-ketoacyl-[acyl-carrier-protein] synthase family protein [Serratia marcescens]EGS5643685.1 beta-ketoacyl-[acyl-car
MEKTRRVVVTGYGAVTALGGNAQQSWQAIMASRLAYRYHDKSAAGIHARFFALLEAEPPLEGVAARVSRRLPRFARLALAAAAEAIEMAFSSSFVGPAHFYSSLECGAIIGSGWGGQDEIMQNNADYLQSGLGQLFGCFHAMPNIATAICGQHWLLRGYQGSPAAACATGGIAIGDAFEVIRCGRASMMLAGASESLRGNGAIWNMDALRLLSREQKDITKASCPFSRERNGFVLAEGAAVLCLEEREAALARGATILGEIKGYGNFSDAFDLTAPSKDPQAKVKTLRRALEQAGLGSHEIDYINAHGTSTLQNDVNETEAIKAALGRDAYRTPISSTKSYTGHLLGASGSFEAIVCLQALQQQMMPATCHLHETDPACDLDYIREGHRHGRLRNVMSLSFGFGGANAALVFGNHYE